MVRTPPRTDLTHLFCNLTGVRRELEDEHNERPVNSISIPVMKALLLSALLIPLSSPGLLAGPLDPQRVAGDAKWVIHLDVDRMLKTRLGNHLSQQVFDAWFGHGSRALKNELGVDLDWRRIQGLTLYGADYRANRNAFGVLLIDTALDLQPALDAILRKQTELGYGEDGPLIPLVKGDQSLYSLNREAYLAVTPGHAVVLGQSRDQVEAARSVLLGQRQNLRNAPNPLETPAAGNSFFTVAAGKGFARETPLPPQARLLQMTEGLQATVAESGNQIQIRLTLLTRDADSSRQVVQVIQGLLALVAIGPMSSNAELVELTRSLSAVADGPKANVTLQLPLETIQRQLKQHLPSPTP